MWDARHLCWPNRKMASLLAKYCAERKRVAHLRIFANQGRRTPYHHLFTQSSSTSRLTRCLRVLEHEPVGRAAGAVARAQPLRHDALEAHSAAPPHALDLLTLI